MDKFNVYPDDVLVACGCNTRGQCGVQSSHNTTRLLSPVAATPHFLIMN